MEKQKTAPMIFSEKIMHLWIEIFVSIRGNQYLCRPPPPHLSFSSKVPLTNIFPVLTNKIIYWYRFRKLRSKKSFSCIRDSNRPIELSIKINGAVLACSSNESNFLLNSDKFAMTFSVKLFFNDRRMTRTELACWEIRNRLFHSRYYSLKIKQRFIFF